MKMRTIRISELPGREKFSSKFAELTGVGNWSLLERRAIGVCGSRSASEFGLERASDIGRIAAEFDHAVVTGNAKGVDKTAQSSALEAGGAAILVLPEGIGSLRLGDDVQEYLESDRLLIVSPYEAEAPWTVWRAMNRNGLIVDIASDVFVIDPGAKGGTLDAGLKSLKAKKPLWVLQNDTTEEQPGGNADLLARGGRPFFSTEDIQAAMVLMHQPSGQPSQPRLEFASHG